MFLQTTPEIFFSLCRQDQILLLLATTEFPGTDSGEGEETSNITSAKKLKSFGKRKHGLLHHL